VDLGTAFARAAVTTGRAPSLVLLADGSPNLPAVVAFSPGAVRVGQAAVEKTTIHPEIGVRGVKRLLGRAADDPVVASIARFATYGVVPRDGGGLAISLDGELHDPEDVAAALIAHLAEMAAATTGERPNGAVIAAPHHFGARQRRALDEAVRRAGLETRQILGEGTAIALSLASAEQAQQRVGVADVGAGGLTVSIVETGPARAVLLGSAGDALGGGDDIDRGILAAVLEGLRARWGDFPDPPAIREELRRTCERLKRDLDEVGEARAVIPFLPVGKRGLRNEEIRLDRAHLDPLLEDTRARIEKAAREALAQAQIAAGQLGAVVAAGGLAKVPAVRATIERVLGPIRSRRFDPDAAVAMGAAIQASMLTGAVPSIPVVDVHRSTLPPPPMPPSIPPAEVRTAPPRAARSSLPPEPAEAPEELRLEVASLLASLRAGAVTQAEPRRAQRMVRINVDVDADDLTDPNERAEMAQRLHAVWNQLGLAMLSARQYRWEHPLTARHLDAALAEIERALASAPRGVRFDVASTCLAYDRKPIWKPDKPPFDRVPQQLFSDGLRAVQFKPGVDAGELRAFLSVLIAASIKADADTVSALWEQRLTRIAYVAVDGFVEAADEEHVERDELAAELTRTGAVDLDQTWSTLGEGRREAVDRAAAMALPAALLEDLGARAAVAPEVMRARHLASLPEARREAERYGDLELLHAALRSFADERIAAGDLDGLFATIADLAAAFEAEEGAGAAAMVERELTQAMLPRATLAALFQRLSDTPVASATARALSRALSLTGDPGAYDAARAAYWADAGPIQDALLPYLLEAAGHEAALGKIVRDGKVEHALLAQKRLADLGTVPARAALHEAFASPHLEVRVAAVGHLPEASAETVRAELTRLLEDPEPAVRLRALSVVGGLHAVAAGPVLVRRIHSGAMETLPVAERRLVLETLAQLSPHRAEAVAIELLGASHLLPAQALDDTRVIAAEVLGTIGGPSALAALRQAAERRWRDTAAVREAAARAAEMVAARVRPEDRS
jgi:actin-like ATPase involved in cell morphogenesis